MSLTFHLSFLGSSPVMSRGFSWIGSGKDDHHMMCVSNQLSNCVLRHRGSFLSSLSMWAPKLPTSLHLSHPIKKMPVGGTIPSSARFLRQPLRPETDSSWCNTSQIPGSNPTRKDSERTSEAFVKKGVKTAQKPLCSWSSVLQTSDVSHYNINFT